MVLYDDSKVLDASATDSNYTVHVLIFGKPALIAANSALCACGVENVLDQYHEPCGNAGAAVRQRQQPSDRFFSIMQLQIRIEMKLL